MTDGKRYIPLNILPDGSRKIISRPIYIYIYIYIERERERERERDIALQ